MLSAWEATDKSNELSRDDIIRVLDERIDPSNRWNTKPRSILTGAFRC